MVFFPLPVVVPHQLATLKRACCGFFLKKQRVAANSASERLWELLSAGVVAAVGKAQTICSAAGTQPVSWVWLKWMPAQPSGMVCLPWCIPTLAWWRLGDARPASLLCIVTQIVQEQQSSHHGMLSKESEPGALQISIFSPPRAAKAVLSQEGCMKYACHSCARH